MQKSAALENVATVKMAISGKKSPLNYLLFLYGVLQDKS